VTFHISNQRNPARTNNTLEIHEISRAEGGWRVLGHAGPQYPGFASSLNPPSRQADTLLRLGFIVSVWFLAAFPDRSVSADMPVPPQTKQEGQEQSPEQEINRQPEPIHCKLHDRAVDKAPTRTVSHRPIHLGHPYQWETPAEPWDTVDDVHIWETEAWLTAADKPCE
jgi:hypothetical protein